MKHALALALILLVASPAFADEPSAEDRYHEAYVQEVIEGKVAEAAKAYLALMADERAGKDVRAEARLRFAICTVLLGRADEAKLQLGALIADEATPEGTRKRAEAYLASIGEVGVGTEIDRKLESLVFDLARVSTDDYQPAVYRDFEVLGVQALPFLRKLRQHPDVGLARHAFRLLTRMDEPGLGALWTPRIGLFNPVFAGEWALRYLRRRPEELRAWEATLLALGDDELEKLLLDTPDSPGPGFSLAFMEELVGKRGLWETAMDFAGETGTETERWVAFEQWLESEDEALAAETAAHILRTSEGGPDLEGARRRWPRILELTAKRSGSWKSDEGRAPYQRPGFPAYLRRLPTPQLLESLEYLIEVAREATRLDHNPLLNHLASWLARTALARDLDAVSIERAGKALESWLEVWHAGRTRAGENEAYWLRSLEGVREPMARYLELAAPKDAETFLGWLLEGPARDHIDGFADAIGDNTEGGVQRIRYALRVARPQARVRLAAELPDLQHAGLRPKTRIATLEALPEAVALVGTRNLASLLNAVSVAAQGLPQGERTRLFRELVQGEAEREDGDLPALLHQVIPLSSHLGWKHLPTQVNYLVGTALPVLDEMWDDLPPAAREKAMTLAWQVKSGKGIAWGGKPDLSWWDHLTPGNRHHLAAFLRKHVAETPQGYWERLYRHRREIPIEGWLPVAPSNAVPLHGGRKVPVEEADRVARLLVADLDRVNTAFLVFVRKNASRDVQQDVFDRVLRAPNPVTRRRGLYQLQSEGHPASLEALLDAREAVLAEETPEFYEVEVLAGHLMAIQPSERVFPLARLLLKGDRNRVMRGIRIARNLGRQDLIDDLTPLLDSMDRDVRESARQAIKAIRDVAKMER